MAIEAKISFVRQLETRLSSTLTVDMMTKLLSTVHDVMEGYKIEEVAVAEDQEDLLTCYIDAMRVQGRSEATIRTYTGVIKQMMESVKAPIRRITVYHLRNYIAQQKEKGNKDSTLESKRQIFSAFFGWLHREGLIEKDPVVNLGSIKCPKVVKELFTEIDMEKMKQSCRKIRDKAIISFLASTGCRVGELVALDRDAVDLNKLECVVRGKGNKERTVFLDSVTAMFIRMYLKTRRDDDKALFVNKSGKRFGTDGIRDMLVRIQEASGVTHVHPHKFRRTLATNLAKRGMPIQDIAAILGHDKIETTMEYVMMNINDIRYKYRQFAS